MTRRTPPVPIPPTRAYPLPHPVRSVWSVALFGLLALTSALLLSGCGDGSGDGTWTGTVRDSLGIQIVTSPEQGIWTEETEWRVAEELRIGVAAGDPELEFGRVGGVDVDGEGRIYVLDSQAARVRVFSPDGQLLHAFGRAGSGPGELSQGAMGLFLDGGSTILVADLGNQRLARFTLEGEALPAARLDLTDGIPMAWNRTPGGEVLKQVRRMDLPGMAMGANGEPMDFILRLGDDGAVRDTLAVFPAGETFTMSGPGGMPQIRLFAPERVWTTLEGPRVVTGLNSEYSLWLHTASGEAATIIRREFTRRPVTDREIEAFLDAMRSAWDEARVPAAAVDQLLTNVEFEEHWPALAALLPGPEGTLWVQRVDPETALDPEALTDLQSFQPGSPAWDVFDADGRYLGVVDLPTGFTPSRFTEESAIGIHRDELGVERIMRLRLERP